jgi:predicted O-methyltransferase YrrM
VGGLTEAIGDRIVRELVALSSPTVLETGAGATTLLFLCFEPHELTSIAPDQALYEGIREEARLRGIDTRPLRFLDERSEIALPRLADQGGQVDVALIDGNHGWPAVFVDFCYINRMMRRGALLFIDDVHLYSVCQLVLLLRQQDDYELVSVDQKLATFRKKRDRPFLPDWRAQPFIFTNTVALGEAVIG